MHSVALFAQGLGQIFQLHFKLLAVGFPLIIGAGNGIGRVRRIGDTGVGGDITARSLRDAQEIQLHIFRVKEIAHHRQNLRANF